MNNGKCHNGALAQIYEALSFQQAGIFRSLCAVLSLLNMTHQAAIAQLVERWLKI
jgi:hypothetical protein